MFNLNRIHLIFSFEFFVPGFSLKGKSHYDPYDPYCTVKTPSHYDRYDPYCIVKVRPHRVGLPRLRCST